MTRWPVSESVHSRGGSWALSVVKPVKVETRNNQRITGNTVFIDFQTQRRKDAERLSLCASASLRLCVKRISAIQQSVCLFGLRDFHREDVHGAKHIGSENHPLLVRRNHYVWFDAVVAG